MWKYDFSWFVAFPCGAKKTINRTHDDGIMVGRSDNAVVLIDDRFVSTFFFQVRGVGYQSKSSKVTLNQQNSAVQHFVALEVLQCYQSDWPNILF